MPLSAAAATVAAAGISAGGSLATAQMQQGRTKKQQARNYEYWKKQQAELNNYQIAAEKRQYDYNKELQDYVYGQNVEQWKAENAYNSPSAQMSRYAAAGLNPALIYGQSNYSADSPTMSIGSVGSGSAPSASGNSLPPAAAPDFSQLGVNALSAARYQLEAQSVEANVRKTNADAESQELDNEVVRETLEERKSRPGLENQSIEEDITKKVLDNTEKAELIPTEIATAEENLQGIKNENALWQGKFDLQQLQKEFDKYRNSIAYYDTQIKRAESANIETQISLENRLKSKTIEQLDAAAKLVRKQIESFDKKLQAELAVSAASALNLGQSAHATEIRNNLNDIVVNPQKDVTFLEWLKGLTLKMFDEENILQIYNSLKDQSQEDARLEILKKQKK